MIRIHSRRQAMPLVRDYWDIEIMLKLSVTLSAALLLGSCASSNIIVDRKGVDPRKYDQDLNECTAYANEVDSTSAIAKSAGLGAAVGGAIGVILGNGQDAAKIAGAGAVQGGTSGGLKADKEKQQVVRRCLIGRGYKVLN